MPRYPSRPFPLTARIVPAVAGLRHRLAFGLLLLCTTVLAVSASAATVSAADVPTPADGPEYGETTDIVVVEVPILVTRDGKPVRDLTADQFKIKIDGQVQEIRSLEMVDLYPSTAGPEGTPVHPPISGRRHFLLLFDLAHSEPTAIVRARSAARDVVHTMHPSDLVAVGTYDQIRGLEFLLGFTTDRDQVDIALESFGLPGLFHPVDDPLRLSLGDAFDREVATSPGTASGAVRATSLSFEADSHVRELVDAAVGIDRSQGAKRFERMAENFESMARGLAAVEGQVHIVYLSEGFPSGLLVGAPDSPQTRDDIERGRIWKVDSEARYGVTKVQNDFERMLESLRRSGAMVHSIDVGGLRAEESVHYRRGNEDVLNAIAQDTGGEFYDNFNDLGDAMGLILEATSVTYLATLQPLGLPMDGEYRKLKVQLENGPGWSTKVSHRAGFFAPRPFELIDDVTKRLTSAQLVLGDHEAGTLDLDALAAVVPVEGEKAYVPVLLELDGESLLASIDHKPQAQLQLFVYAFDDEDQIQDFFTEVVDLDLDQLESELRRTGLKYFSHLDLDPGHYRVRILVRDLDSGEYGVRTADVTVEPGGSALLPVMVADRLDSWVVRESASRLRDVPFPFVVGDEPFFPRAKLSLPRSGTTDVVVQTYGGAGGTHTDSSHLKVRLLDLDGNPATGEARLELAALESADAEDDASNEARVARGTLATQDVEHGVYDLVLTAPGAAESRIRVEVQ